MFNYFKKYLLIVAFLGVAPSALAMEDGHRLWTFQSIKTALTGFFAQFLPSIPSTWGRWKIRKRQNDIFDNNNIIDSKFLHRVEIAPESTDIVHGGFIGILKKANMVLLEILETAWNNGSFEEHDIARIKMLLLFGANPNLRSKIKGQTVLHLAALLGSDDLFECLLKHGADYNAINEDGKTPIDIKNVTAALVNILETVVKNNTLEEKDSKNIIDCIQQGAHHSFKFGPEQTPLISFAAGYQNRDLFYYLLQLGADINAYDIDKETPLYSWLRKNDNQTSAWFPGKYPKTFYKILEDLLKNGANTNAMNRRELTPLLMIINGKNGKTNFDLINYLIQYGANINYKVDCWSPLQSAINGIEFEENDSIKLIKTLCNAGVSLTDINDRGDTAFHLLANQRQHYTQKGVETLITEIHFKDDEEIIKTIKATLLAFNSNDPNSTIPRGFPKEIVMHILSMLLSPEYFHQGLYNELLYKNYKPDPLLPVNNHIHRCLKILEIQNHKNETALKTASKFSNNSEQTQELLSGNRLIKNLNFFNQQYSNISSISVQFYPLLSWNDNLALQVHQQKIKQIHDSLVLKMYKQKTRQAVETDKLTKFNQYLALEINNLD